jgi:hypothetical protein
MMFLLVVDVSAQIFDVARTHRERAVAVLPIEVGQIVALRLDPLGRIALQFFQEILEREIHAEPAQDMDVVGQAADAQDRALEFVAFATEAVVDFVADFSVVEEGVAVFG